MSMDYPFYEQLVRRRHHAAWWWLIGDRLYYIGLLPGMLAIPGLGAATVAGLLGYGWLWANAASILFVAGMLVCVTGSQLKRRAYRIAERDGITTQ